MIPSKMIEYSIEYPRKDANLYHLYHNSLMITTTVTAQNALDLPLSHLLNSLSLPSTISRLLQKHYSFRRLWFFILVYLLLLVEISSITLPPASPSFRAATFLMTSSIWLLLTGNVIAPGPKSNTTPSSIFCSV